MGVTLDQEVTGLVISAGFEVANPRDTNPLTLEEQDRLRDAMKVIANWSRGRPLDDDDLEFLFAEWPPRPESPPTPAADPNPASR